MLHLMNDVRHDRRDDRRPGDGLEEPDHERRYDRRGGDDAQAIGNALRE